jgi:hypothetical protein
MASREEMLAAIGDAIQTYANLEFRLFQLTRSLLDANADTAGAVFYSLRNSRDRNAILKHLLRINAGPEYGSFWKSMSKLIRELDDRRNQIVHGLLIINDGTDPPDHVLARPESYWKDGRLEKSLPMGTSPPSSQRLGSCPSLSNISYGMILMTRQKENWVKNGMQFLLRP